MLKTDVIIVGKGIAGLITAYLLERKGIDYLLLDRVNKRKSLALAETLPPSALPLLQSLQLGELFESCAIRKTHGYHSIWGQPQVVDHNFFFHRPYNYGLKLDKQTLLIQLEKAVAHRIIACDQIKEITNNDSSIEVLAQPNIRITSKVLIEATGRNRAVLKKLGIGQTAFDGLVAFTCHIPRKRHPRIKHDVFVEAFDAGWGIVSGLNQEQQVMSLFTLRSNPNLTAWKDFENWQDIISSTQILQHFLPQEDNYKVIGGDANSSQANQIADNHWLAVGDAAMAFDPLSSHGITTVLFTANKAVDSIASQLKTGVSRFDFSAYSTNLQAIFKEYLKNRTALYQGERRWEHAQFWQGISPTAGIRAF